MKAIKTGWVFLIITLFIFPLFNVQAIQPGEIPNADSLGLPSTGVENTGGLLGILGNVVGIVWKVFFIIAVLFILIAAFNYLTAGGDEEKIKTSHKQITWAAVAIVVALLSVSFSVIIQNFIGKQGGGNSSSQQPSGYWFNNPGQQTPGPMPDENQSVNF